MDTIIFSDIVEHIEFYDVKESNGKYVRIAVANTPNIGDGTQPCEECKTYCLPIDIYKTKESRLIHVAYDSNLKTLHIFK